MFVTTIALPVRRIPAGLGCDEDLLAVVTLTDVKAERILRLMRRFTRLASRWVGAYQITLFDDAATFVFARSLAERPPPNDFLIVEGVAPSRLLHAGVAQPSVNIMPGAVTWSAPDFDSRFVVTTIELGDAVLRRIARGLPLLVGSTGAQICDDVTTQPLFIKHADWARRIN